MQCLVHIAKCGGGTVYHELLKHGHKFSWLHLCDASTSFNPNNEYIITLRNPVDRFVSAFYWRKHEVEVCGSKREGEKEYLDECAEVEDAIDRIDECKKVWHIEMDIYHDIGNLLSLVNPSKVKVIVMETLADDMKKLFDIDVTMHKHKNVPHKKLSSEYRQKLKDFLRMDYFCIQKLFDDGKISKDQFEILMK